MRTLSFGASLLLLATAAACGGDDGGDNNNDNNNDTSDDITDVSTDDDITDDTTDDTNDDTLPIDAPTAECLVPSSLGTVTPPQSGAEADAAAPTSALYFGITDAVEPIDVIQIELYTGFGVFADDETLPTGTYQLTGEETDYGTCGACVRLFVDTDDTGASAAIYMPTSGSLTISSVSGQMTGTLSNANLIHVNIAPQAENFATTPHPDGCATTLANLAFDATIEIAPEMRQVGGRRKITLRSKKSISQLGQK